MKRDAVIFDLDGTLLDTIDDLADSCNAALQRCGFPAHARDAYFFFVGEGVATLIRRIVPPRRRDAATLKSVEEAFREEYGLRWNVKSRPYDGVEQMLGELKKRNVRAAVLSNKPDDFTGKCVATLLAGWDFDPVRGQRAETPRKPDPAGALEIAKQWGLAPERIAYIGDTATDMETAIAAGMYAVGVTWGFRPEKELRDAGAEVIVHAPAEIPAILDGQPTR